MKQILAIIMMLTSACATAQIYSSEACFYLRVGADPNSSSSVWRVVSFRGNKAVIEDDYSIPLWSIQERLKTNKNYYEEKEIRDRQNGWIYTYDSSMSTSSRYVYKRFTPARVKEHPFDVGYSAFYEYIAVSKDNTSLIKWREQDDEICDKAEYIRIAKSEVLPRGINRDFLE